jgi:hypothetical protein
VHKFYDIYIIHEKTETSINQHKEIFVLFGDRIDSWILRFSHLTCCVQVQTQMLIRYLPLMRRETCQSYETTVNTERISVLCSNPKI